MLGGFIHVGDTHHCSVSTVPLLFSIWGKLIGSAKRLGPWSAVPHINTTGRQTVPMLTSVIIPDVDCCLKCFMTI